MHGAAKDEAEQQGKNPSDFLGFRTHIVYSCGMGGHLTLMKSVPSNTGGNYTDSDVHPNKKRSVMILKVTARQ